jgi:hypothetical protein
LVGENMIASMEEQAGDDIFKLQSNLNVVDACGNSGDLIYFYGFMFTIRR